MTIIYFVGLRNVGKMTLFFGCRQRSLDLHSEDKEQMVSEGVLDKAFLALSREPSMPKVSKRTDYCSGKFLI